jgi:hypothetical protein
VRCYRQNAYLCEYLLVVCAYLIATLAYHRPSLPNSELTRSILCPLSLLFAVDTRVTWPIEHIAAGGAEFLLILNKALGYATRIRDSVPAKPHRIRRTCICIILRVGDRR